jgi:hypothetical protein
MNAGADEVNAGAEKSVIAYKSDSKHLEHSPRMKFKNSCQVDINQLVAMIARYHRRASPKPTHETFARLDRDSRVIVSRLAGILRVAVALDHTGSLRGRDIECTIE